MVCTACNTEISIFAQNQSSHHLKTFFFMNENELGTKIIGIAIDIHRQLGPGLFEIVYETVLYHKLIKAGLHAQRQVPVPIIFEGVTFDEGFRADIIVEKKVILELKAIEKVSKVHKKQLLTYLKLTDMKLGYLINFNEVILKEGITRIINGTIV